MGSDESLAKEYKAQFDLLEATSSTIFLFEYLLRIYVVPDRRRMTLVSPCKARLRWVMSVEALIDLASFLPWFIERIFKNNLPNLAVFRVLRIVRILKASPVCSSFDLVARVLYYNADILSVALLISAVLILGTSTLLWVVGGPEDDSADDFSSIAATMYLSVMMLTGQGEPDGTLPWYTKVVVVMTAILAVAQFAIPASMLTWGFEQEAARLIKDNAKKVKKRTTAILAGEVDPISSSSSDEDDRTKLWEEYEDEVVGESSESSDSGSDPDLDASVSNHEVRGDKGTLTNYEARRARRIFRALDKANSNFVNTDELATITKEGDAGELMKQLDPDEDGKTHIWDFYKWLALIKKRYPHQVLVELLRQMNAKCESKDKDSEYQGVGDMVKSLEEEVKELRKENARLKKRNRELEALTN